MTTEHVSVPRDVLEGLIRAWMQRPTNGSLQCATELREAILSRATPSNDVDCSGKLQRPVLVPPGLEEQQDSDSDIQAKKTLLRELIDHVHASEDKPSAPRVVKDEDVERAARALSLEADSTDVWDEMGEKARELWREDVRLVVRELTSLPAAIHPGFVLVPVEPTEAMTVDGSRTYESMWNELRPGEERIAMREAYKAMIAAAPKTEGKV